MVFIPGQKTNIKLATWCLEEHIVLLKGSNGLELIREPQYTKIKGTIIFFSLPTSWQSLFPWVTAGEQHNFCISRLFSHHNILFLSVPIFFSFHILSFFFFFRDKFYFQLTQSYFLHLHRLLYRHILLFEYLFIHFINRDIS